MLGNDFDITQNNWSSFQFKDVFEYKQVSINVGSGSSNPLFYVWNSVYWRQSEKLSYENN